MSDFIEKFDESIVEICGEPLPEEKQIKFRPVDYDYLTHLKRDRDHLREEVEHLHYEMYSIQANRGLQGDRIQCRCGVTFYAVLEPPAREEWRLNEMRAIALDHPNRVKISCPNCGESWVLTGKPVEIIWNFERAHFRHSENSDPLDRRTSPDEMRTRFEHQHMNEISEAVMEEMRRHQLGT